MNLERLIELAGKRRPPATHRVTYAQVLACCPLSKAEMLDALTFIRDPKATAVEVRTSLRQLTRALPRAGLHRRRNAWRGTPDAVLQHALRSERQSRMSRMTRTETADALVRIMAGGPHEFWLTNRLGWAFTQLGKPVYRWGYPKLDGDPDEIADGLFRLDAAYHARLAAPEMGIDELVGLVVRIKADIDLDFEHWRDEDLIGVLEQQLPNAGVSDMLFHTHTAAVPETLVRLALSRTRPDPTIEVIYD